MTDLEKAARQALEALNSSARNWPSDSVIEAITALRRALEQPAIPQGWHPGDLITEEMHQAACKVLLRANGLDGTPQRMLDAMLAVAPEPEQPAQQQEGPIAEGWQITVAHGHSGYAVYAHMEDYPEEGAVLVMPIEQPAQGDPCPGCRKGIVCRTPKCGRLKLPVGHPFRSQQPAPATELREQEPVAHKQEPVAWMDGYRNIYSLEEKAAGCEDAVIPLYTRPQQPARDEPVAKVDYKQRDGFRWLNPLGWQRIPDGASLYTRPQAREWVGLTTEEWRVIADEGNIRTIDEMKNAIEAKLREKNT